MIYHFQGRRYLYCREFMQSLRYKVSKFPYDITIITCSNREDNIGLLISQLKRSGVPYINLVPRNISWDNRLKLYYILESLKQVTTKYVLILDAFDVVCSEDNTSIIDIFKTFNKKLVFNASKNNYPKVTIDIIPNRDALGPFKYLNAGCCIGETEYAKSFYSKCYEIKDIDNPDKSEQLIVRHVFADNQEDVGIDSECKLFQTLGHCEVVHNGDSWVIK